MAQDGGDWGQDSSGHSKPASICESANGRLRFRVELRPGETTIVSWKKLLKEANLSEPGGPDPLISGPSGVERQNVPQPQPRSPSAVVPYSSRKVMDKDGKDSQSQAGSNRLSTVIERIERMYAGDGSSDEEAGVLDNVPYDDEYDTSDSFIDDAELDDYFQVDNSAIKHDGFFVNRGKLERIEPTISKDQQPKKRRRKNLAKGQDGDDAVFSPNKIAKLGEKAKEHSSSVEASVGVAIPGVSGEAVQFRDSVPNGSEVSLKKKVVNPAVNVDPLGLVSQDINRHHKETDQRKPEKLYSTSRASSVDSLSQRSTDKILRREGSSARPKGMMLDKAIKELEKIVAKFRPPSTEVQDPDNSSQAVKRRLPPEIKLKLAKVARLAQQANCGTVPKDVINRLMSIVGHLMQVRTLKRNLKLMAKIGLSAKQEKDARIQRIKQEIAEMVKLQVSYRKSKGSQVEQQVANSDVNQEDGQEKKDIIKQKYCMDDVLENKICELYDVYLEGLEEDSRPSVRRLYEELTILWPSGYMDTDGIKRAIHRAKERRGGLNLIKREKIRKRRPLAEKEEDASKAPHLIHSHKKKLPFESRDRGFTLNSRPVAISHIRAHSPAAPPSFPRPDKLTPDKAKGSHTSSTADLILKKKVKKKPNADTFEAQLRLEKLAVSTSEERQEQRE